jgi:hypothetical protein
MTVRHRLFAIFLAAVGLLSVQTVQAQAFSDYAENKIVDAIFRGQALGAPATLYFGLSTTACSDSSVGTEVTGGDYARVAVTASLANLAGTQSAGSTSASSGTGGTTSNNAAINFPTPTAGWGTVSYWFIADASSGGNIWICDDLTTPKTINAGDTVSFAIGSMTITVQ